MINDIHHYIVNFTVGFCDNLIVVTDLDDRFFVSCHPYVYIELLHITYHGDKARVYKGTAVDYKVVHI